MGKYRYRTNVARMKEENPNLKIDEYLANASKLYMLEAIANELAEANRLKIEELNRINHPDHPKVEYLKMVDEA